MAASGHDVARRKKIKADDCGSALVEFAVVAIIMLILVFGLIDFSRAIYDQQVIINLTGEGCSMSSRGTNSPGRASSMASTSMG